MKLLLKSTLAISALGLASVAMAADPIVGSWNTPEGGVVRISQSGNTFTGKVTSTRSGRYVNKVVISGLRADGGGKYSGGEITDPQNDRTYRLTASLNGNSLVLKGHFGPLSRSQTWTKR